MYWPREENLNHQLSDPPLILLLVPFAQLLPIDYIHHNSHCQGDYCVDYLLGFYRRETADCKANKEE